MAEWWPPKVGDRLRDSWRTGTAWTEQRGRLWLVVAVFRDDGEDYAVIRRRRHVARFEVIDRFSAQLGAYRPVKP